jgi:hypothetical protein
MGVTLSSNSWPERCLFEAFEFDWKIPDGPLDTGYFPARVAQVFARKEWLQVDREHYRQDTSIIYDLAPKWFVYYTQLFFLSAVEETQMPAYSWEPIWIEAYGHDSMFSGAYTRNGASILTAPQFECLCSVARFLDSIGYPASESTAQCSFEALFRAFVGG